MVLSPMLSRSTVAIAIATAATARPHIVTAGWARDRLNGATTQDRENQDPMEDAGGDILQHAHDATIPASAMSMGRAT